MSIEKTKKRIGANLKSLRLRDHMSYAEIKRQTGLTWFVFKNLENGKGEFDLVKMLDLCSFFAVSLSELVDEQQPERDHRYYELRKLEIPNLYKTLKDNDVLDAAQVGLFSFLSPNKSRRNKHSSKLNPLIRQKVNER